MTADNHVDDEVGCGGVVVRCVRRAFRCLGDTLERHARLSVAVSLVISVALSAGIVRMRQVDHIRDSFTPRGSDAEREWRIYKEFFKFGEPYLFHVLVLPANSTDRPDFGGNMLDQERLLSAVELSDYLMHNCTVECDDRLYRFDELCAPHCAYNEPVRLFHKTLEIERDRLANGDGGRSRFISLDYPRSTVLLHELYLGRNLFGVRRNVDAFNKRQTVTPIATVGMVQLIFRADRTHARTSSDVLQAWENNVAQCITKFLADNPSVIAFYYGDVTISNEIVRTGMATVPYFAVGLGTMLAVALGTIALATHMRKLAYERFLWVAVAAVVSPCLAVGAGMGGMFWLGERFGSILTVVPFLVLAIGVDDGFLMVHSWQKLSLSETIEGGRLGLVLADVGPSITITSLTNVLAFAIGAFTPTPEIRLFCRATAFCISVDFILQVTLFAPILLIATPKRRNSGNGNVTSPAGETSKKLGWIGTLASDSKGDNENNATSLLTGYCKLFNSLSFRIVVLLFAVIYWTFAAIGALKLTPALTSDKFVLADSFMNQVDAIRERYKWREYYEVLLIVKFHHPLAIGTDANDTSRDVFNAIHDTVDELEDMPQSKGPNFTQVWVRDYEHYQRAQQEFGFLPFNLLSASGKRVFDPLLEFFRLSEYSHWNATVKHHYDNQTDRTVVDGFVSSLAYHNLRGWADRIAFLQALRKVAGNSRRYGRPFEVSIFEPDAYQIDQVLGLTSTTIQTVAVTMASMAVVCAAFLPALSSLVSSLLAIASICFGVIGFLSLWGADLDPISMATILMSIGFSVDYTAHVTYHYHSNVAEFAGVTTRWKRVRGSLDAVGWPMVQAGASTVVTVSALWFVDAYMAIVFVHTVTLVVVFGILHGIVFLPALLVSLPQTNCPRRPAGANVQSQQTSTKQSQSQ